MYDKDCLKNYYRPKIFRIVQRAMHTENVYDLIFDIDDIIKEASEKFYNSLDYDCDDFAKTIKICCKARGYLLTFND